LSSLLRAEAVAVLDRPASHHEAPRVFGRRLLRDEQVGLQKPMTLPVPIRAHQRAIDNTQDTQAQEAAAPPPDFAAIEEAARLQGHGEGYEAGYAEGLRTAEDAMARNLQHLTQLLANVHENQATFFRAAERQVVDLALQIAQKVVEREIENMPDLAVNVIRGALEEMDARTAQRLRLHPDDEEVVRRRWSQVVPPGVNVELVIDDRVQPGGAIIETTQGQVDAQLDTKLAQLGNALWTFVMDAASETAPAEEDYAA
jgi:flagellar assembly protein FliH